MSWNTLENLILDLQTNLREGYAVLDISTKHYQGTVHRTKIAHTWDVAVLGKHPQEI